MHKALGSIPCRGMNGGRSQLKALKYGARISANGNMHNGLEEKLSWREEILVRVTVPET